MLAAADPAKLTDVSSPEVVQKVLRRSKPSKQVGKMVQPEAASVSVTQEAAPATGNSQPEAMAAVALHEAAEAPAADDLSKAAAPVEDPCDPSAEGRPPMSPADAAPASRLAQALLRHTLARSMSAGSSVPPGAAGQNLLSAKTSTPGRPPSACLLQTPPARLSKPASAQEVALDRPQLLAPASSSLHAPSRPQQAGTAARLPGQQQVAASSRPLANSSASLLASSPSMRSATHRAALSPQLIEARQRTASIATKVQCKVVSPQASDRHVSDFLIKLGDA